MNFENITLQVIKNDVSTCASNELNSLTNSVLKEVKHQASCHCVHNSSWLRYVISLCQTHSLHINFLEKAFWKLYFIVVKISLCL